jgi:hypothetical protein
MLRSVVGLTLFFTVFPAAGISAAQVVTICIDFTSQSEAQAAFEAAPENLSHLAVNGDGIACEPFLDVQDYDGDGDIDDLDKGAASLIERGPAPTPRPTPELFEPPAERSLDDDLRLGLIGEIPVSTFYTVDSVPPVCDAIGFSVPKGLVAETEYMSLDQEAHYRSCNIILTNEARCTSPFAYEHPTDPTLSTPSGMWVVVCSVYFFVGDYYGVVADPVDFQIVDAQGQAFPYRPFPIMIEDADSEVLARETFEPGATASGRLTFTGQWSDLDPSADYPIYLEWSPVIALRPNPGEVVSSDTVLGDYGNYDREEVAVSLFTIIEEPYPANVVDYDS